MIYLDNAATTMQKPQQITDAIVSLNIGGYDSGSVSDALSEDYGIAICSGAHCAPRMHQALRTEQKGAVRFSFFWFNTEDEVDTAICAIRELSVK